MYMCVCVRMYMHVGIFMCACVLYVRSRVVLIIYFNECLNYNKFQVVKQNGLLVDLKEEVSIIKGLAKKQKRT